MPEFVLAYHGTRADATRVRQEGLRIPSADTIVAGIEQIARDAGFPDPPKWARDQMEQEVRYRRAQGLRVHLTLNREQALSYSFTGGELATIVAHYRFWKARQFPRPALGPDWTAVAEYLFGPTRTIVTVRLPWDWLPTREQQAYTRLMAGGFDPSQGSWDIGIARDIPASFIVGAESA